MPTITDWLMVGITVIYVIATVAIWKANDKSAKATREQVEESKKQFKESQRLECMPFLQLEKVEKVEGECVSIVIPPSKKDDIFSEYSKHYFLLRNLGKGTAINLYFSWEDVDTGHDCTDCPSISAIMSGDSYQIRLETKANEDIEGWIEWHFDDMIKHHYHQRVKIKIVDNRTVECDNDQVVYEAVYLGETNA